MTAEYRYTAIYNVDMKFVKALNKIINIKFNIALHSLVHTAMYISKK